MKKYPIQRKAHGQSYPLKQYNTPNISVPSSIIPKYVKGRNVAAQVTTKIHLENARGEKMTIVQNQQLLNLLNNTRSSFEITHGINRNNKGGRKR